RKAAAIIEKDPRQKRSSGDVRGDSAVMSRENEGGGPGSLTSWSQKRCRPTSPQSWLTPDTTTIGLIA
ncbi:MAG: hypothetical protein P8M20_10140, partial [Planctomycetaceae bacterium]|nr:hypothetical protein [Planctomycetaceae bacterium]